jgi:hypothetical protein
MIKPPPNKNGGGFIYPTDHSLYFQAFPKKRKQYRNKVA